MDQYKTMTPVYGTNGANGTSGHDKVAIAKQKAAQYLAVGKEKSGHYVEVVEQFVRTKPAAALAIAAGAGWLIGRILKSRRKRKVKVD